MSTTHFSTSSQNKHIIDSWACTELLALLYAWGTGDGGYTRSLSMGHMTGIYPVWQVELQEMQEWGALVEGNADRAS